ncbi:MAG: PKD domain-containing protein, partial [Muribaculaceae bacterium]|nr:PKD domain-containing protein [Muribaculaceae bacterium]
MKPSVIVKSIVPAFFAGAILLFSCTKDDVIEVKAAPEIEIDSETGVYTVKVGRELKIAPVYKNCGAEAIYQWKIDSKTIATTPVLTYTWDVTGKYYVTIAVSTNDGHASEELLVEVVDLAKPVISLPVGDEGLTIAKNTDYVLTPEISNSNIEGFGVTWSVNGVEVGNELTYTFNAAETGEYRVSVTARNIDGSDTREFVITVVNKLPEKLSFPTPGYSFESTDRYTFAGRSVCLKPIANGIAPTQWSWTVNGVKQQCSEPVFMFTPDVAGDYQVTVTVDNGVSASVKVVCVSGSEESRYRAPAASSLATCNKVFEWIPAPGQFIGETQTGGMTGNETTLESANEWARKRLADNNFVSLGGFGGYIVVGFDHSIAKGSAKYDFAVAGNAFFNALTGDGGSNEPGIVYVMQDVNGNGLPDDEWYELRGSETGKPETIHDYAVTYYRPSAPRMNVQWTDNLGASGTIDYLADYHTQNYYYPAWITDESYTLSGTRLESRVTMDSSTGYWELWKYDRGYVDNMGSDVVKATSGGQRNGFKIANAMYANQTAVNLKYIDFIKVQTGVNAKAGWLGEVSTEVFGFEDLN